jgi:ribose transport system ATP-binding protein
MTSEDMGPLMRVRDVIKTYGPTVALSGVTLDVRSGEVLGIVGHNGAGKSTLMRTLCGIERPSSGTLEIEGRTSTEKGSYRGVRMAYQEGSLAPELTVKENIYLSANQWMPKWRWHGPAANIAKKRLKEIFPDNSIRASDYVDDLPLADRPMVEISRATITDDLRLLILDEPTESLSGSAVDHLYGYVRKLRAQKLGIVLVSHRLKEILSVCDRVAVMKDGAVVSTHLASDVTERDLFMAMGGEVAVAETGVGSGGAERDASRPVAVQIPMKDISGADTEIYASKGEVIGLAGIAGQGQEDVLARLWNGVAGEVTVDAKRAYVPGDRQRSGIFPLWNVASNLTITAISDLAERGLRQTDKEDALVKKWVNLLNVRGGAQAAITGLSGGNQQKVIVARAFASDADTILLDDPFRGVDIHTKSELYQLIRDEARAGRTIVWYSSENSEMRHCDRAYVLRAGRVAAALHGAEITDEHIIAMSFAESKGSVA